MGGECSPLTDELAAHAATHAGDLTFPIGWSAPWNRGVLLGGHAARSQCDKRDQEETEHGFLGQSHEMKFKYR